MPDDKILTLNAGSSSIKFALYSANAKLDLELHGQVENIANSANLQVTRSGAEKTSEPIAACDHAAALRTILEVVHSALDGASILAVGHRITHGGPRFAAPRILDEANITTLKTYIPWAPLHQPYNIATVEGAAGIFPDAIQVGCFDTGFHHDHPWHCDVYALPRHYYDQGLRRYGFHGLSYESVLSQLKTQAPDLTRGKLVVAHLGNGASMCAIVAGRSVASTMGFTALDGLAMGTRCGAIDPGVLLYLLETEGMSPEQLSHMLYRESGLLGLSGLSSDMRILESSEIPEARQAIDYFVHRIRTELGALAMTIGGLDGLVFCGGIGENSSQIRARVCHELAWAGINLDARANQKNETRIGKGKVQVLVVRTDEEKIIAQSALRLARR
ncbi:MAG: acetate/propionate family kinase [Hyphomicrobiaceae bacterium]|nr:acetate/propionate family kinase [Hyphomicrobiaceae bacterium]MCC0011119.1 acetate/propionate family kinase [Hyphomicrobiaceae bacterium]